MGRKKLTLTTEQKANLIHDLVRLELKHKEYPASYREIAEKYGVHKMTVILWNRKYVRTKSISELKSILLMH